MGEKEREGDCKAHEGDREMKECGRETDRQRETEIQQGG